MRLTKFSDYTLRVLIYLATERKALATIPDIASAYGISGNHLTKVVHRLALAGIVESTRGKGGGIRLGRSPEDIRIGQIVRMSEGETPIVECLIERENTCCIAPACRLSGVLMTAFEALYAKLDEFTLADLTGNRRVLNRLLQHS